MQANEALPAQANEAVAQEGEAAIPTALSVQANEALPEQAGEADSQEALPAQADADAQAGEADSQEALPAQVGEADSQVGNESATITQEGETDSGQSRFIRRRGGLQSAQLRGWGCPILGFCVCRKLRGQ